MQNSYYALQKVFHISYLEPFDLVKYLLFNVQLPRFSVRIFPRKMTCFFPEKTISLWLVKVLSSCTLVPTAESRYMIFVKPFWYHVIQNHGYICGLYKAGRVYPYYIDTE